MPCRTPELPSHLEVDPGLFSSGPPKPLPYIAPQLRMRSDGPLLTRCSDGPTRHEDFLTFLGSQRSGGTPAKIAPSTNIKLTQLHCLALDIYNRHFRSAQGVRAIVLELRRIGAALKGLCRPVGCLVTPAEVSRHGATFDFGPAPITRQLSETIAVEMVGIVLSLNHIELLVLRH